MKTYIMGTRKKYLGDVFLMNTHNVWFHREIRKILCGYPLISEAMLFVNLLEKS